MDAILTAALDWRQLKNRETNPQGSFDSAGRWYPVTGERQSCCDAVRSPSRAYPYGYLTHCRSAEHVAARYGVDVRLVKLFALLQQEYSNDLLSAAASVIMVKRRLGNTAPVSAAQARRLIKRIERAQAERSDDARA